MNLPLNVDLFEENVKLWSRFCAKQAIMLSYVDISSWHACQTEANEKNLKKNYQETVITLHEHASAKNEAKKWFSSLQLESISTIYIYGIGLGYYYDELVAWLAEDSSRQAIFLEDDLVVIAFFLQTERATALLTNDQCHLYYFENSEESKEIVNTLFWSVFLTKVVVSSLASYFEHKKERFEILKNQIEYDISLKNSSIDEYLCLGDAFFLNFYPNMRKLSSSLLGNKLFGKFPHIPAIICGAGPSLTKQLKLLSTLQQRALIFAGGSSLNALSSNSIAPHFGANIDPNAMQLERIAGHNFFETPIFYRNRLYHKAFEKIEGPKLYITGSGGYDIATWFEQQLGIEAKQELSEGYNVINFCIEIAAALGCNPIILVGMDLAYTNSQIYAEGIGGSASLSSKAKENLVIKKDLLGNPIYTEWKWIVEAQWISEFAKKNTAIKLFNATEGGMPISDVSNISFEKIIETYLSRQWDLSTRVAGELMNCSLETLSDDAILAAMNKLKDSLEICIDLLKKLVEENDVIRKRIEMDPNNTMQPLQTGLSVLYESDLEEQEAFSAILSVFNEVYNHLLEKDLRPLYKTAQALSWHEKELKKLDLAEKKYHFLSNVAKFNFLIIEKVF